MSEEMESVAVAFLRAWAPPREMVPRREEFCQDLADLLSMSGREIILNALRRAE